MRKPFLLIIVSFIMMTVIVSCQQNNQEKAPLEYLTIGHKVNSENLTQSEKRILQKALLRLDFKKRANGSYSIVQKSAQEVYMSEEIFDFFKMVMAKTVRMENMTRGVAYDDSLGTVEGDRYADRDCVIYTIVAILGSMGQHEYDFYRVQRQLQSAGYYVEGEGTYLGSIRDALALFFNVQYIYREDYSEVDPVHNSFFAIKQTRLDNGHNSYHSGTLSLNGNGGFMYRDDQQTAYNEGDTTSYGFASYDDIYSLYKLTLK